ncbi:arylsulfatase [Streptomyces melanosporofaciens]|uniref:Arylsulfatase n=1 Tax=Streptomyces melanosporofaciens TaxID=67327 RepID=A0A1H5CBF3_STRMJ|nr:arylsulfatase [Streptomyces melanosporofaciens]SED64092.1 arylsulfatase [Streptomyces melanosporofaciens]
MRSTPSRPNIVVVLLDDCGFAQLGCFGAAFETPATDALAREGLRFNRFHVTALCSPSRASLLTGRNHHAVGMGLFPETPTDRPGYSGRLPEGIPTLPSTLRDHGYSTFAVGKWHLTPRDERSAAGPFQRWPLGLGFDRYYGFLGSEANMWAPTLTVDNHHIGTPERLPGEYHLTEDLADQAIRMIRDQQQADPQRPFFMYFAPSAPHAPHHVAPEWSDAYRGRFDDGWEALRERVFRDQVRSGVVPPGTRLTPRPSWVAPWDELGADERRLYARMHEVFGGLVTHTDQQIGRLVSALDDLGVRDNTIIMVLSDNGASAEGGPHGTLNETGFALGGDQTLDEMVGHADTIGGPDWYNHYAWGWAWAGNTPFHLWKRYTWLGGTRVPFIVSWPRELRQHGGEIRSEFGHIVDLMPTICEAAGIDTSELTVDGRSMVASMRGERLTESRTQYFEMLGTRSIYRDDWKATTNHVITGAGVESELLEGSKSYDGDTWHLFDLSTDFSEAVDVAADHPEILEELRDIWWEQAERDQVLPMIEGSFTDLIAEASRAAGPARTTFSYQPATGPVHEYGGPVLSPGFTLTAHLKYSGAESGILCAQGDWNNGWALFFEGGHAHFVLSRVSREHHVSWPLPRRGAIRLELTYRPHAQRPGGTLSAEADGAALGEVELAVGIPPLWHYYGANLCIGYDEGLPVSRRYEVPFTFTGDLEQIVINTKTPGEHVEAFSEAAVRGD